MFIPPRYSKDLIPFYSKISLSRRFNVAGNNNTYSAIHVICPISTKFGITLQIFIEVPNIKFHLHPPSGCHIDPCLQTNGHGDGNGRLLRLCECA
jgi:hypothetical protein